MIEIDPYSFLAGAITGNIIFFMFLVYTKHYDRSNKIRSFLDDED